MSNDSRGCDAHLDASGLPCPHPVLRVRRALRALAPDQVLEVIATDASAPGDLAAFARRAGHELLASERHGDCYRLLLRKRG